MNYGFEGGGEVSSEDRELLKDLHDTLLLIEGEFEKGRLCEKDMANIIKSIRNKIIEEVENNNCIEVTGGILLYRTDSFERKMQKNRPRKTKIRTGKIIELPYGNIVVYRQTSLREKVADGADICMSLISDKLNFFGRKIGEILNKKTGF